jgi:hypothetical protein
MSAVLLLHAALGCCWHHAHKCDGCETASVESSADHCEHAGCHEQHGSGCHQNPSPCKCRVECQGVCTFLPPGKVLIDLVPLVSSLDVTNVAFRGGDLSSARYAAWSGCCPNLEPPLRLHLLHQSLLI